jgi:hypothetical protein
MHLTLLHGIQRKRGKEASDSPRESGAVGRSSAEKTKRYIYHHNKDCNIALSWTPEGRRKRGRPKTTWRRTVEKEREESGWRSWAEARVAAADRDGWSRSVDALRVTKDKADR